MGQTSVSLLPLESPDQGGGPLSRRLSISAARPIQRPNHGSLRTTTNDQGVRATWLAPGHARLHGSGDRQNRRLKPLGHAGMSQDWSLPPHTEAKHKILRYYLGAWFAIMAEGSPDRRFVFLDGFAGRGRFNDGQLGSPLIALEVLLDHPFFGRWSQKDFIFTFVEPHNDNFENLCTELEGFWSNGGASPATFGC